MPDTERARKRFGWLKADVAADVLIIKTLILIYGFQSYQIVTDKPLGDFRSFFAVWKHWDAEHYLKLASNGYAADGDDKYLLAFFPLYPWLVSWFGFVFRDSLFSAFVVSGIASVALALIFRELARLDCSEKTARLAVFFLFIFPTGFFLHIPYTESLFIALCLGSFLAARKRNWLVVGIVGALACLTRINGLILFPAVAFEVWAEYRETQKLNVKWLFVFLIPAGFAAYLLLNYVVAGDALAFLRFQREHWGKYARLPVYGVQGIFNLSFNPSPSASLMNGIEEMFFLAIGILSLITGWRHLRNSYRVWMILNLLLFTSISFVQCVPRYTLVLFPLFILMARASAASRQTKIIFTVWSLLYLALFTTQFVRGWWAF